MKYSDLSFVMKNENGEELINDITSVIPNNNNPDEPYVLFTDYSLDENDEFVKKYGKLVHTKDGFALETNLSVFEKHYIDEAQKEEVIQYVNEAIGESLYGE